MNALIPQKFAVPLKKAGLTDAVNKIFPSFDKIIDITRKFLEELKTHKVLVRLFQLIISILIAIGRQGRRVPPYRGRVQGVQHSSDGPLHRL